MARPPARLAAPHPVFLELLGTLEACLATGDLARCRGAFEEARRAALEAGDASALLSAVAAEGFLGTTLASLVEVRVEDLVRRGVWSAAEVADAALEHLDRGPSGWCLRLALREGWIPRERLAQRLSQLGSSVAPWHLTTIASFARAELLDLALTAARELHPHSQSRAVLELTAIARLPPEARGSALRSLQLPEKGQLFPLESALAKVADEPFFALLAHLEKEKRSTSRMELQRALRPRPPAGKLFDAEGLEAALASLARRSPQELRSDDHAWALVHLRPFVPEALAPRLDRALCELLVAPMEKGGNSFALPALLVEAPWPDRLALLRGLEALTTSGSLHADASFFAVWVRALEATRSPTPALPAPTELQGYERAWLRGLAVALLQRCSSAGRPFAVAALLGAYAESPAGWALDTVTLLASAAGKRGRAVMLRALEGLTDADSGDNAGRYEARAMGLAALVPHLDEEGLEGARALASALTEPMGRALVWSELAARSGSEAEWTFSLAELRRALEQDEEAVDLLPRFARGVPASLAPELAALAGGRSQAERVRSALAARGLRPELAPHAPGPENPWGPLRRNLSRTQREAAPQEETEAPEVRSLEELERAPARPVPALAAELVRLVRAQPTLALRLVKLLHSRPQWREALVLALVESGALERKDVAQSFLRAQHTLEPRSLLLLLRQEGAAREAATKALSERQGVVFYPQGPELLDAARLLDRERLLLLTRALAKRAPYIYAGHSNPTNARVLVPVLAEDAARADAAGRRAHLETLEEVLRESAVHGAGASLQDLSVLAPWWLALGGPKAADALLAALVPRWGGAGSAAMLAELSG